MNEQLSLLSLPLPNLQPLLTFEELRQKQYANIIVEWKPRLHKGWRVTWNKQGEIRLVLPELLKMAPLALQEKALQWALLTTKGKRLRYSVEKKALEKDLHDFLHSGWAEVLGDSKQGHLIRKRQSKKQTRRIERLQPQGSKYNLEDLFAKLNIEYFDNQLTAKLTWSHKLGGLSTHSVQSDGEGQPYDLISISRGYDFPDVPAEVVAGVLYHECLHIVCPPRTVAGRRIVHGADFRKLEKQYKHYKLWMDWHKSILPRKLYELKRQRSRKLSSVFSLLGKVFGRNIRLPSSYNP